MIITDNEFKRDALKFDSLENRGFFYPMFLEMIQKGLEKEAYLFILSTWNFKRFGFAMRDFDIKKFEQTILYLRPYFDRLRNKSFETIKFDNYEKEIEIIFNNLGKLKGIEYTGASKIMHLQNPSVFVMWDSYISGQKPKKYYRKLKIIKDGKWKIIRYDKDGKGYIKFLKDMKDLFRHIKNNLNNGITFAKLIDQYNYVNITLPIQEMENKNKKKRKNR